MDKNAFSSGWTGSGTVAMSVSDETPAQRNTEQPRHQAAGIGWSRWGEVRSGRTPATKAFRQLTWSAPQLVADALKACEREGVDPTSAAVQARISRRIGLNADAVARGLEQLRGPWLAASLSSHPEIEIQTADDDFSRLAPAVPRAFLHYLANEVLGERERIVFLARSTSGTDPVPPLEGFATQFGMPVDRVRAIEASARRKIATSLEAAARRSRIAGGNVVARYVVAHASPEAVPDEMEPWRDLAVGRPASPGRDA